MLCTVAGLPLDVNSVVWSLVVVECWLLFVGCVVVCVVWCMVCAVCCLLRVVYSSLAPLCC